LRLRATSGEKGGGERKWEWERRGGPSGRRLQSLSFENFRRLASAAFFSSSFSIFSFIFSLQDVWSSIPFLLLFFLYFLQMFGQVVGTPF
jgi:hypothetical protein